MHQRSRQTQLRVITLLGGIVSVALAGFLVWRVSQANWALAAFDGGVIVAMLALVALARRRGQLDQAGTLMCAFNSLACMVAAWLIGPAANGWVYLALMCNFYIAPPRVAVVASGALVAVATAMMFAHGVDAEALRVLVTWTLVCVFTYVFANQMHIRHDSLVELASLDTLTQLPNRLQMEADLGRVLQDAHGGNAALLVLDVDRFKRVNDTQGHTAGDEVLKSLAAALRTQLRRGDHVYRFGGEEFVLLIAARTRAGLEAAAERIRAAVEASVRSGDGPITVSIGGALYHGEDAWQDWFSRADGALYQAKRAGRNRVCVAATPKV